MVDIAVCTLMQNITRSKLQCTNGLGSNRCLGPGVAMGVVARPFNHAECQIQTLVPLQNARTLLMPPARLISMKLCCACVRACVRACVCVCVCVRACVLVAGQRGSWGVEVNDVKFFPCYQ